MGQAAQDVLEGLFDYETGELIDGEAPGYPRRMADADRRPTPGWEAHRKRDQEASGRPFPCPGCARAFHDKHALIMHRTAKTH